jgi:hypothetical protein
MTTPGTTLPFNELHWIYIVIYDDDSTIPDGEGALNLGFVSPM